MSRHTVSRHTVSRYTVSRHTMGIHAVKRLILPLMAVVFLLSGCGEGESPVSNPAEGRYLMRPSPSWFPRSTRRKQRIRGSW